MNTLETNIIHELMRRHIHDKNMNKIIESIYEDASKNNLTAHDATVKWIKEGMKKDSKRYTEQSDHSEKNRYEAVYLPFNSRGANDPEKDVSQLKVFTAPDDWTAMVYGIALVSADRENYFKNENNVTRAEARNYVDDFLYPESFPTGISKRNISLATLYDMLQDSQNDDGTGDWEPETDFGYLFSLKNMDGNILYEGDLDPHDWNYESFTWWHNGAHINKYGAYVGDSDEVLEDHLPKRRF